MSKGLPPFPSHSLVFFALTMHATHRSSRLDINVAVVYQPQVAVEYFSTNPHMGFALNTYKNQQDVIQAILGIPFISGETDIGAALNYLRTTMYLPQNGGRTNSLHMAIFISDAVPTVNMADVMPAGIAAKIAGIDVSCA